MNPPTVRITAARDGYPLAAVCDTCGATWERPTGDPNSGTLHTWERDHGCPPALPVWLDDIDPVDADALAVRLHVVAIDLLRLTTAASRAHSELMGADGYHFWRAIGRHDGLREAQRYVLALVEHLQRRAGGAR